MKSKKCLLGRLTSDRGSMVPLLALVLVGFALAVGSITVTAQHSVRMARAQWAADAAALAAAAVGPGQGGIEAAKRLAEANGAQLVGTAVVPATTAAGRSDPLESAGPSLVDSDDLGSTSIRPVVVVEVEYAGVRAESAARRFTIEKP